MLVIPSHSGVLPFHTEDSDTGRLAIASRPGVLPALLLCHTHLSPLQMLLRIILALSSADTSNSYYSSDTPLSACVYLCHTTLHLYITALPNPLSPNIMGVGHCGLQALASDYHRRADSPNHHGLIS